MSTGSLLFCLNLCESSGMSLPINCTFRCRLKISRTMQV